LFAGKSRAASREEQRHRDRNWPAQTTRQQKKGEMDGERNNQVQDEEMFLAIRWAIDKRRSKGWAMYRSTASEDQSP